MKILVIAHPDDEILWFNPELYDLIVFVFTGRNDKPYFKELREKAISEHPLKVKSWGLTESGYWRDKSKLKEYEQNYKDIVEKINELLLEYEVESIDTHNAYGEYGHLDHVLIHDAIMDTVNCPVNGKNPKLYREIKKIYKDNNIWTWYH